MIRKRRKYNSLNPYIFPKFDTAVGLFDACSNEGFFHPLHPDCDFCPVSAECQQFFDEFVAHSPSTNPYLTTIKSQLEAFKRVKHGKVPTVNSLISELEAARLDNGLTQVQLATKLNINQSYLSLIERGKKVPSPAIVSRIRRFVDNYKKEIKGEK